MIGSIIPRKTTAAAGGSIQSALDDRATKLLFGWKARSALYRLLASRLRNNIELELILQMYARMLRRKRRESLARLMDRLVRDCQNGRTFAEAMQPWIPQDETLMITSGERAGALAGAVELIVDVKGRVTRIVRAVRAAGTAPLLYIGALFGFVWMIGTYFTPKLEAIMPPGTITGDANALVTMGKWATSWVALIPFAALAVLVAGAVWALPNYAGRGRTSFERLPPFSIYRDIQGYMWLLSFTALLAAGVAETDAMKLQRRHGSPWLRNRLGAIIPLVVEGTLFPAALQETGNQFPNADLIDEIESVWGFKDTTTRLLAVTRIWADELEYRMAGVIKRVSFASEVAMYALIGFVVYGVNDLMTQIGNIPVAQ